MYIVHWYRNFINLFIKLLSSFRKCEMFIKQQTVRPTRQNTFFFMFFTVERNKNHKIWYFNFCNNELYREERVIFF